MSREKVYALLREHPGEFFSGEEISRRLGVSRAAVWKAIDSLRRDGYTIDARKSQGYCLTGSPDALVEREIRRYLPEGFVCRSCAAFQRWTPPTPILSGRPWRGRLTAPLP